MREDIVREFCSTIQDAVEIRQVGLIPLRNLLADASREIGGLGESELGYTLVIQVGNDMFARPGAHSNCRDSGGN